MSKSLRIMDESELTKIVVVGQRAYVIPKDVFDYMDGIHNKTIEDAILALKDKIVSVPLTRAAADVVNDCIATLHQLRKVTK